MKWGLTEEDIEWTMDWGADHKERFDQETQFTKEFEEEMALAHLLMNEIVFTNSFWWEKDQKPKRTGLFVILNDIFAWACSDGEELEYEQIEPLYRLWRQYGYDGVIIWACRLRNEQPQGPVKREMIQAGHWLDDLEALPANKYDVLCRERCENILEDKQ